MPFFKTNGLHPPGPPNSSLLLWAVVFAVLLSQRVLGEQDEVCRGSKAPVLVYKDGFGVGWVSGSRGTELDAFSTLAVRNGTAASLSTFTEPFAEISFQSSVPFCKNTILDMWVQGNILNSASIVLMSTRYNSVSQQVPLWIAEPEMILTSTVIFDGKLRIQGPDNQNWFRVSVNLLDIASTESPPPSWDIINIRDDSGRGLSMFLSEATILPDIQETSLKETKNNDCIGSLCNPTLASTNIPISSGMVPLFGYTPVTASLAEDAQNRGWLAEETLIVNAKLWSSKGILGKPEALKNWELINFCGWIQGKQPSNLPSMDDDFPVPPLFDLQVFNEALDFLSQGLFGENALGTCFLSDWDIYKATQNPKGNVDWPVLSVMANSYDNLTAIRTAALGKMEWMDKDELATKTQHKNSLSYNSTIDRQCDQVPWGLSRLNQKDLPLDKEYSVPYTGAGVHVYVLDTGVSPHSDFGDRLGVGVNCISGECRLGDSEDFSGHGTHVAGTIGGNCYGVAKGVTINPVKVLGGPSSQGSYAGIISGIKYAAEQAQANGWPAVINLSLGGPRSSSLDLAVQMAISMNVTVVVSSGNDFFVNACTMSPASATNAMTVAATDAFDLAASFSNIGPCVDIWAPGKDVASADRKNYNGYTVLSGTSMSAPHVSGVSALVLQQHPEYNPAQVSEAIFNASVSRNLAPDTTKRMLNVVNLFD